MNINYVNYPKANGRALMNRYNDAFEKYGIAMAVRLRKDTTAQQAFRTAENAAEAPELAQIYNKARKSNEPAALFAAFAYMTDPSAGKTNRPWKYLDWICSCYLQPASAVQAEDLYKIHDELSYLEAASRLLAPEQRSIRHYDSFAALRKTLLPFIQERDRKKAEREDRRMDSAERQAIMNETSIIYDGPEGKVVVPHSIKSCIYWGRQTKWCISAEKANNFFKNYNDREPIWIYLTKPTPQEKSILGQYSSYKFAGTGGYTYDEHDHTQGSIPPHLDRLIRAALAAAPRHVSKHLKKLGGFKNLKPLLPANPAQWTKPDVLLKAISLDKNAGYFFPPSLCRDAAFMTNAIKANKHAESFVDPELLADRAFVLAVIETGYPAILEKAAKNLQKDTELLLTAISKSDKILPIDDMGEDLCKDKDFMMKAVGMSGDYWKLSHISLRNDRDLLVAALTSAVPTYIHTNDIPFAFLDDKEIGLYLVATNRYSYESLSRRLQQDEDVQLALVENDYGSGLTTIPESLITKKVALCALQKSDYPYQIPYDDSNSRSGRKLTFPHLPSALLDDADVMSLLAERQPDALQFASDRLCDDKEFILRIVAKSGSALPYASQRLKKDKDIVLKAIENHPNAILAADRKFLEDDSVMMAAIAGNGLLLEHASYRLKKNRKAVEKAETISPGAMVYAALELRLDKTLLVKCALKRAWRRCVTAPAANAADRAKGRLRSAWNKAAAGVSSFSTPRLPPPQP